MGKDLFAITLSSSRKKTGTIPPCPSDLVPSITWRISSSVFLRRAANNDGSAGPGFIPSNLLPPARLRNISKKRCNWRKKDFVRDFAIRLQKVFNSLSHSSKKNVEGLGVLSSLRLHYVDQERIRSNLISTLQLKSFGFFDIKGLSKIFFSWNFEHLKNLFLLAVFFKSMFAGKHRNVVKLWDQIEWLRRF